MEAPNFKYFLKTLSKYREDGVSRKDAFNRQYNGEGSEGPNYAAAYLLVYKGSILEYAKEGHRFQESAVKILLEHAPYRFTYCTVIDLLCENHHLLNGDTRVPQVIRDIAECRIFKNEMLKRHIRENLEKEQTIYLMYALSMGYIPSADMDPVDFM